MKDENKELTPEQIEELEKKNKKQKRKVIIRNIVIIGLIVIIILLLLAKCSSGDITPPPAVEKYFNTQIDNEAGKKAEVNKQAEEEELNRKLKEGEITISINKTPALDKEGKANLNIENKEENAYPQIVELWTIENTNEGILLKDRVYQSGLIPIGNALAKIDLDVYLEPGQYDLMAVFYNVEETTGKEMGAAQTPILLTILE